MDSASFASHHSGTARAPSAEVALLLRDRTSVMTARFAVELLAIRNIAARWVHARAGRGRPGELRPYLRVFDTDARIWRMMDQWPHRLADNLLLWSHGDRPVLDVDGARGGRFDIRVQSSLVDSLEAAVKRLEYRDENLVAYSLLSLPLQTQDVYRILLMVPIGAFIMLLLRNLVGVKTFGTFMPVLIALSFKWTSLLAGVVLFVLVVGMGLLVRFYMERLKLLLVPRLTSVLIVVVLIMAFVSVLANRLGLEVGLSIALFPMIIMTMTIERVSVAWDERGAGYAMKMAGGSLLIACLAYLVMSWPPLEHLVFVFPELLLVLLGLTLLLGRYSGYRLTELFRFRALAGNRQGVEMLNPFTIARRLRRIGLVGLNTRAMPTTCCCTTRAVSIRAWTTSCKARNWRSPPACRCRNCTPWFARNMKLRPCTTSLPRAKVSSSSRPLVPAATASW